MLFHANSATGRVPILSVIGLAAFCVGCTSDWGQNKRISAPTLAADHQPKPVYVDPAMVQSVQNSLSDAQLLAAWDRFGDPRLRTIQSIGLNNSVKQTAYSPVLSASSVQTAHANASHGRDKRQLLVDLAKAVSDTRFHLDRLQSIDAEIKRQGKTIGVAELRAQIGRIPVSDVDRLRKDTERFQSVRQSLTREINQSANRLEALLGSELTQALLQAIGDQPQLQLQLDRNRFPASRLRKRSDVHTAGDQILRSGQRSGITEAELFPLLSLDGYVYPNKPPTAASGALNRETRDPATISMNPEDAIRFGWMQEGSSDSAFQTNSALQNAMVHYHTTVSGAAKQVGELLTSYFSHAQQRDKLREELGLRSEELELAVSRFAIDRSTAAELIELQGRKIELELSLHRAEWELAKVAIELFVASGGPQDHSPVVRADFFVE